MNLRVRFLRQEDGPAWDDFVRRHRLGGPFHLLAWKQCIEATYRYLPQYLLAEDDEGIRGLLPLFLVSTLITGRALISTPFAVYGGILSEDAAAREALRESAEELSRKLRVQYTELRNAWPEQTIGWLPVERYATFTQRIAQSPDEILAALPRETRRMTRRALECGYETTTTRDIDEFLKLYLANLRKLGTPAFPRLHFENLMLHFPDAEIREIRLEGKVVAAVLNFYHGERVLPYYGASNPEFNRFNPNNFMYYDVMCEARAKGLAEFDFGRSKLGSGSYAFKTRWGMTERSLPYEMLLVGRSELPNISPTNPKYETAIKAWSKLPLWVTNLAGPYLIRMFP